MPIILVPRPLTPEEFKEKFEETLEAQSDERLDIARRQRETQELLINGLCTHLLGKSVRINSHTGTLEKIELNGSKPEKPEIVITFKDGQQMFCYSIPGPSDIHVLDEPPQ